MLVPHDSAVGHVTGQSQFIEDIPPLRGELLVAVVPAMVARGRVQKIHTKRAEELPGVVAVLTASSLAANCWGPASQDQPILVEQQIEYFGEPVAVVVAENPKALAEGVASINIELLEDPVVLTIEGAENAQTYLGEPIKIRRGEPELAMAGSEYRIQGKLHSKGQDHFYFESNCVLAYPGENGEMLVHSSTQHPTEVQHTVAAAIGVPYNKVVCVVKRLGGGFGGKESQASHYAAICALAASVTGKSCRLALTKDEDMQWTGKRHPFFSHYEVGFDSTGKIQSLIVSLRSDGGAYLDLSQPVLQRAVLHVDNAYFIPHIQVEGRVCKTNKSPNTAFRGFGGPQGVILIESILEEIATTLNKDPLTIRQENLYCARNKTTHYGQEVDPNPLGDLFSRLIESSDYYQRRKSLKEQNSQSRRILKGISITPVKFGISFTLKALNQANALVNVYTDGSVQVSTGATEMGQGVNTNIGVIVSKVFGIPLQSVKLMPTSTEKNANTSATAASSATDLNGAAAEKAALKIKTRLAQLARYLLCHRSQTDLSEFEYSTDVDLSADEVVFKKGLVFLANDPQNFLSWGELTKQAHLHRVALGDYGFFKTPKIAFDIKKGEGRPFLYYTYGVAATEVSINKADGSTQIDRVDILMDLGRSIVPGIDRGQVTGGFVQGMGWVTCEDLVYSPLGVLETHSPTTYKIPNIQDIPDVFNVEFLENTYNHGNVRGSKAVGEPPFLLCCSVWTAIKSALAEVSNKASELAVPASNEEILRILGEY